jgi:cytochrome c biogenesis protein CcmG/thiol:disulfide interchange protein DsbE
MALVVGVAAVAVWQATSGGSVSSSTPLVGRTDKPAPVFSLPSLTISGQTVSLASLRGKPVVLNFWASWCVPCRTEMPLIETAYRAHQGQIQFLGIDANDSTAPALAFLRQVQVTYPTAVDTHGLVANAYGLFGLPTTIFISSSGRIVGRYIGQMQGTTLEAAIKEAFHE